MSKPPDLSRNELLTDAEALRLGRVIESLHRDLPSGVEVEITLGRDLFFIAVDAFDKRTPVGDLFLERISEALEHQLQVAQQISAAMAISQFDKMDF